MEQNNSLSEAELLALLDNPDVPEEDKASHVRLTYPSVEREAIRFIEEFNIKPGIHLVRTDLISKLYSKWSKCKVPQSIFIRAFTLHFQRQNNSVLIDADSLTITKKTLASLSPTVSNKIIAKSVKQLDKFFKYYNISQGQTKVPAHVLHYLYDKWTYKNKSLSMTEATLSRLLNLYLIKKGGSFLVTNNINKHVSREEQWELKRGRSERRKQASQKSNKKKQSKVSSTS